MIYTIFLQQILYAFLALFLTFIVGKIITAFIELKGNFFFRLFITYIVGITAILLSYSIVKAHGRTVNLLVLPILCYFIYYFRYAIHKRPEFHISDIYKELCWSLIPIIVVFLYQSFFYFDFCKGELKPLFCDFHRYAIFTQSIHLWGLESYLAEMNYFFPSFRTGIVPYHYPELWMTSLFSTMNHNSLVNSYYFTVYPLLTATFILGVMSLFEISIRSNIIVLIFAVAVCFITDITFRCYMETPNSLSIFGINGQKLAFVYCFLLLGFILIKQQHLIIGQLILVIIPFFSTIFLPGIWGGLLVYNSLALILFPRKNVRTSLFIIASIVVVLLFYSAFLNVFQSPFTNDYAIKKILSSGIFSRYNGHLTLQNIKMIGSNFIHYSIPNIVLHSFSRFILYVPFFLLFYRSLWKQKQLFILSLSFLIVGALATSVSKILLDSNQFTHLLGAVFIVLIIICIADFNAHYRGAKWKKYSIVLIGIFFICIAWVSPYNSRSLTDNSEDVSFVKRVSGCLTDNQNIVLVFYSKDECEKGTFYNWIWQNTMLNVSQYNSKTILYTMGNPEIYSSLGKQNYIDDYFFNHFTPINTWKHQNKNNTVENFIERYHIKYFYCKKGVVVPDFITKKAVEIIESPSTNNKFIRIK
jgi:hypothetical protein